MCFLLHFLLKSTLYARIGWEMPFSSSLCASTKQLSLKLKGSNPKVHQGNCFPTSNTLEYGTWPYKMSNPPILAESLG